MYAAIDLTTLGIIAVALLVLGGIGRAVGKSVRRRVRRATNQLGGLAAMAGLAAVASQLDMETEERPKSLSGGDSLFLPQILKDFPDFNLTAAKETVRAYLAEKFADREGFAIHNVIISDYRRAAVEKTVVFQCAYEYLEEGRKRQFRCCVHYSYRVTGEAGSTYAAPNCPNCGAPITSSVRDCPYCGARLFMSAAAWEITDCYEK